VGGSDLDEQVRSALAAATQALPGGGDLDEQVRSALAAVTQALPGGGEERPGQVAMATAIARAISEKRSIAVQAGTGTGKSLAYLVPAVLSGKRVVVATATKALQDQLAGKDLPQLAAGLPKRFRFAVLKGRSNYLCVQKVREVGGGEGGIGEGEPGSPLSDRGFGARQPVEEERIGGFVKEEGASGFVEGERERGFLEEEGASGFVEGERERGFVEDLRRLLQWAKSTKTGDVADAGFEPDARAWAALSTTARECPGASRCPSGAFCFAEAARQRAATADVVVTNMHLYAYHLANESGVLPPHDVVVFDEAHQLEDVATAALGIEVSGAALRSLSREARPALGRDHAATAEALAQAGETLDDALSRSAPKMEIGAAPGDLAETLALVRKRLDETTAVVRELRSAAGAGRLFEEDAQQPGQADGGRADRVLTSAAALAEDLRRLSAPEPDDVVWVERADRAATLKLAPVDISSVLSARLWPEVTAVLASATLPKAALERLGMGNEVLDVGSPFPYRESALLYCAAHLPRPGRRDDPRSEGAPQGQHDEIAALIEASGGRALVLFTSWKAMRSAIEALRPRSSYSILAQGELPKAELLRRFRDQESSCLFATMSFWQGVDVPGGSLSLVVIDRIPFPRPDDPLVQARRLRAGDGAFHRVDLPRASVMLAQGAGRLIRSAADRGVVAVLDSRLATASYRRHLLEALPPMRRSVSLAEVKEFFSS
jgi:ATP-dependent DNA helicase DinG